MKLKWKHLNKWVWSRRGSGKKEGHRTSLIPFCNIARQDAPVGPWWGCVFCWVATRVYVCVFLLRLVSGCSLVSSGAPLRLFVQSVKRLLITQEVKLKLVTDTWVIITFSLELKESLTYCCLIQENWKLNSKFLLYCLVSLFQFVTMPFRSHSAVGLCSSYKLSLSPLSNQTPSNCTLD